MESKQKRPSRKIRHGTLQGYKQFKCRCVKCKEANSIQQKKYRDEHPELREISKQRSAEWRRHAKEAEMPGHGEVKYYIYGCRCEECKAAHSRYKIERRAIKQEKVA